MGAATARVVLTPQATVKVQTAGHEIGTGITTVLALMAVSGLGVDIAKVTVEVGDSALPPAPVAGGSNSTASIATVVAQACEQIRGRIAMAAVAAEDGPFHGMDSASLVLADGALRAPGGATASLEAAMSRAAGGAIEAYAENIPHGVPDGALKKLYQGQGTLMGGAKLKDRMQFAFGAQFVEVRVNARTREIRVPRLVGAYVAGRIVNPKAAKSQLMGGQIWGVSAVLHEATEIDRRAARYTNNVPSEYLIPVNADV